MTTANAYLALADALGALGATLRHHRDLGFTELPLEGGYLLSPEEALRAQEQALAGCRRCRLCEGRTTIVFGSGNPRADFVCIGEGPGADEDAQGLPFDGRAACAPFLAAQLAVIQPKVILSLGSVATQALLGTKEPIGKLRGRIHAYGSAVLIPTFHPAFLLRNPGPEYRRMAWEDLKLAKREYDRRRTK